MRVGDVFTCKALERGKMSPQELWLLAGALYATHRDPAFAALAYRGWRTSVKRGWVTVEVAP